MHRFYDSRIRGQMTRLLSMSALSSFELGGACWVMLLAARGFSMMEIGVAEAVFHGVSLIFEVPSGVISDVFGRRKSMILSRAASMLSSLMMVFSRSLFGVCVALGFAALSYNFASGAREALAYDTLKSAGQEEQYLRYSSMEMIFYRVGSALATLLAGFALWLGYIRANLLDMALALVCMITAFGLREIHIEEEASAGEREPARIRIARCFAETFRFILREKRARSLMLQNALAGAVAILIGFFMQARLPLVGVSNTWLGPALFVMGMGGALGARLALRLKGIPYGKLYAICLLGILTAFLLSASPLPLLMILGGFAASALDDLLQVRTDSLLQEQFPSAQRATLVSVSSLLFSLVMIALSPLAGWVYGML